MFIFNRKLLQEAHHPLHQMTSDFITALKKNLPDLKELDTRNLPQVIQKASTHCPAEYVVEVNLLKDDGYGVQGQQGDMEAKSSDTGNEDSDSAHRDEISNMNVERTNFVASATRTQADTTNVGESQSVYSLVSSLLQHTSILLHADEPPHPVVLTSEVYHRCPVTKDIQVLPIMHQMFVILPQQDNGALWVCFEQTVMDALEHTIGRNMKSAIKLIDFTECNSKNESESNRYDIGKHTLCTTPELVQITDISAVSTKNEFSANIGIYGKLTSHLGTSKFFLLNLDHLVMHKFGIDDIRLLWSEDPCQWKDLHFRKSSCTDSTVVHVEVVSKFPPCYVHDLSFWVKKDVKFDELKFHSVVQRIAGLMLEDVQLIDSYKGDRTSLCYRFVYRSIDKALSKDQARYIQSLVREAVSKELSVELR